MKNKHTIFNFLKLSFFSFLLASCADDADDKDIYIPTPVSPVTVDLTQVPYPKLSDYHFFDGDLKNLEPSLDVLPYEPSSTLFTDYAHKKRFIWLPKGTKATYVADDKVIELPVGAAIIKNFYYDKMQPNNTTQIIETRIMIRKAEGWIFADYIWNQEQTEAFLDLDGSVINITFKDDNDVIRTANYDIPNEAQCITCHKTVTYVNNNLVTTHVPIAIKPQSLNWNYTYKDGSSQNQLLKWIEAGYLDATFSLPSEQNTVVNYNDTSKPLEDRVRAYVDINCAHCHQDEGHCNYRPMRYNFSSTFNNPTNMGVCVNTQDMQDFPPALSKIVTPGNVNRSMMYYRMNTDNPSYLMPLHGRSIIHEEGVALIEEWINSLQGPCE
ncbi:hypothetical protein [Flavobacterium sp.]|uniref:hypothetical protein n=1 Tax=Flavobacterium sp. TaxID=239 RepID=UPI003527C281